MSKAAHGSARLRARGRRADDHKHRHFLHYDIVAFDMFDDSSSGSISCGSPRPNLEIEVRGFNPDLLTGNNIPGDGPCG